jgi:hypothetical protein
MGTRFNPPPGWPPAPAGFAPPPGWEPDPSWPSAPPGWQLWVEDGPSPNGPTPKGRRTGSAVASLVFGVLGFTGLTLVLAAALGIRALGQIRRDPGRRGKGLAIAGLSLAGFWLTVWVVAFAVVQSLPAATPSAAAGTSGAEPSPAASGAHPVGVFSLGIGDCFENPAGAHSVISVAVVPCTKPHNAQVYAQFDLHGSDFSYPGSGRMRQLASTGCTARIATNLDKLKMADSMSVRLLFPLLGSWLIGHRTVTCIIVSPAADLRTSLLRPQIATG